MQLGMQGTGVDLSCLVEESTVVGCCQHGGGSSKEQQGEGKD